LSTEKDIKDVIAGARYIQGLAQTAAIRELTKETLGPNLEKMSNDDIVADFRDRAATVYHPVGTCSMGTPGNTHAPIMMVAHKGSDLILNDVTSLNH
jgi:choline dehydrogenase